MIAQWFISKRPKKAVVPYVPQQHTNLTNTAAWEKAKKLGLSVFEYQKRCDIVQEQLRNLHIHIGDVVYPKDWGDFQRYGKVKLLAICKHYDTYGEAEWNDHTPFLLSVMTMDEEASVLNCSVGWVQTTCPAIPAITQEC